jgi:hypothetical protein
MKCARGGLANDDRPRLRLGLGPLILPEADSKPATLDQEAGGSIMQVYPNRFQPAAHVLAGEIVAVYSMWCNRLEDWNRCFDLFSRRQLRHFSCWLVPPRRTAP